jgi:hypothetical protein
MNDDKCPICLEYLEIHDKQKFKLTCGHEYHTECIIQSLRKNNECPYCRDTDGNIKISIYDANNFNNNLISEDDDETQINNSNFENMCEILKPVKNLLKDDIKQLKSEVKRIEKNSVALLNKFRKDGRLILYEYQKEFKKNDDYITQTDDLKKWHNNCKKIKRKFIKNLKINGIEYGSDIDLMLDNYIYEFLNDDNVWELKPGFHHFFWDLF